jgi:hypothetical protein
MEFIIDIQDAIKGYAIDNIKMINKIERYYEHDINDLLEEFEDEYLWYSYKDGFRCYCIDDLINTLSNLQDDNAVLQEFYDKHYNKGWNFNKRK